MSEKHIPELDQYVVYFNPKDYPGKYVVRRWEIYSTGPIPREAIANESLESIRARIPDNKIMILPDPNDDECILEIWI